MTRAKVIQVWFAAIGLMVVAAVAFGAQVAVGTAGLLVALSLVPPAVVFMLWPGTPSLTAAEVLRDGRRAK
jgi:hypothetical protein